MKYKGLLFIDIDGTFLRWSLFLYLLDKLIHAGVFPKKTRDHYFDAECKWRERRGEYDDYLGRAIEAFDIAIEGVSVKKVEAIATKLVEDNKNLVYGYTRDLIQDKLKDGWYVVALSGSPIEMVEPFCRVWGIHEMFGTLQVRDKKKFTAEKAPFFPENKVKKAAEIMARPALKHIMKRNIWGIGDTKSDIKFLKLMGKAICFNPTRELYSVAKKRGWQVVVERKNVVYEL